MKPVSFLRTSPRARGETSDEYPYVHPLSLDTYLVRNPAATYFVRAEYPSIPLRERGIAHGDVLVVDRSIKPHRGSVVLVTTDGDMELMEWGCLELTRRERVYWGTVTATVHTMEDIYKRPAHKNMQGV